MEAINDEPIISAYNLNFVSVRLYNDRIVIEQTQLPRINDFNVPKIKEIKLTDLIKVDFTAAQPWGSEWAALQFYSSHPSEIFRKKEVAEIEKRLVKEGYGPYIDDEPPENYIQFRMVDGLNFVLLKLKVDEILNKIRGQKASPQLIADEIKKLNGLKDADILTIEEFESRKKKLLEQ